MPILSKKSHEILSTCHVDLQRIALKAIEVIDFSVLCGFRNITEQNTAFKVGNSKLQWPFSRHNSFPSLAMDLAPYPIKWEDLREFHRLSDVIKNVAFDLDISLVWGGDWEKFKDYPHYELAPPQEPK